MSEFVTFSPEQHSNARYDFIEVHAGGFPYDDEVISQEAVVEGSRDRFFWNAYHWLGGDAVFTDEEADTLWQEYWLFDPGFLVDALAWCRSSKSIVMEKQEDAYMYLLAGEPARLREELTQVLKEMAVRSQQEWTEVVFAA